MTLAFSTAKTECLHRLQWVSHGMYSLVVQVVREVAKCVVICNIESRGGAAWFQVGLTVFRLRLYGFCCGSVVVPLELRV